MSPFKVIWFVRRFGVRELFGKALRQTFAPHRNLPTFTFNAESYRYLDHPYNWTWLNERCVEIPIALRAIRSFHPGRVLEIGNVLSHYTEIHHRVIDKYEGPEKLDAAQLADHNRYDLIVSISTFEHIGFDEPDDLNPAKHLQAINACRNALRPKGLLLLTIPSGYNTGIDHTLSHYQTNYLARSNRSQWHQTPTTTRSRYGHPYPYANQLAVASIPK